MVFSIRSQDPLKRIQRIAVLAPTMLGVAGGIGLFIWGPLFYEQIRVISSAETAMSVTSTLLAFTYVLSFFLEVPTGALGDVMGRKWTVVVSFCCKMLQMIFLAVVPFCNSLPLVVVAGVLSTIMFQLAYAFYSGTFTAWCVDSLRKYDAAVGYEVLLAPASRYRMLGMMFGGLIAIVLYVNSLSYVAFLMGAVVCLICAVYCAAEMDGDDSGRTLDVSRLSVQSVTTRMGEIIGDAFFVFKTSPSILAAVSAYAALATLANITEYFWPVYVRSTTEGATQTIVWMVMVVASKYSASAGSHGFGYACKKVHSRGVARVSNSMLRRGIVVTGVLTALVVMLFSWHSAQAVPALWMYVSVVFAIGLASGIIIPTFETFVNNNIPDKHAGERATILSFASLLRGLMVTLLAIPSWGASGNDTTAGWAIPAIALLIVVITGNRIMKRAESKAPKVALGDVKCRSRVPKLHCASIGAPLLSRISAVKALLALPKKWSGAVVGVLKRSDARW